MFNDKVTGIGKIEMSSRVAGYTISRLVARGDKKRTKELSKNDINAKKRCIIIISCSCNVKSINQLINEFINLLIYPSINLILFILPLL